MCDDLKSRLIGWSHVAPKAEIDGAFLKDDCRDAADRIRELEAENAALLEKLRAAQEENRWAYIDAAMEDRDTPAPVSVGMLEQAYLLGFNVSSEGWNGESPYRDNNASPTTDAKWIETRDAALRALADKGEEG